MAELRPKQRINVHIFNAQGEDSVIPFDAHDWNVNVDKAILEIICDDEEGNERVVATFNHWTFVESK